MAQRITRQQFDDTVERLQTALDCPLTYTADGEPTTYYQVWTTSTTNHSLFSEVTSRDTLRNVYEQMRAILRSLDIAQRPKCATCGRDIPRHQQYGDLCGDCERESRR